MVFPLPLVPFEKYMLADERPAYPMDFFFRLGFAGRLSEPKFRAAWKIAVDRHPLLNALVVQHKGRMNWVAANVEPLVDWSQGSLSDGTYCATAVNLSAEPGVRAIVREDAGRTELLLQFHHTSCDGLGAVSFINDLLVAYEAQHVPALGIKLRRLEPESLKRRNSFGLTPWRLLKMAPKQAVGLLGARQFLGRTPSPLIAHQTVPLDQPMVVGYPSAITRRLTATETTATTGIAQSLRITTNDLLLTHLFGAIDAWRRRHSSPQAKDWIRLSVPMNLRTVADRRLPAANVVSMVFLDRQAAQIENFGSLAQSVNDEMQLIKRLQLGLTFVLSLRVADALGALPQMCKTDTCRSTSMLTNLGDIFDRLPMSDSDGVLRLHDGVLDHLELIAPIRPLTIVAVATFVYAGRLSFTWQYDPRVLSAVQVAELADEYQSRLQASVAAAAGSS